MATNRARSSFAQWWQNSRSPPSSHWTSQPTHRSPLWLFPAPTRRGLRHSLTHNGGPVTRSSLQSAFRRAVRKSGIAKRKEWKSYANLHQFDTANAHIAEGLIWASLCAAVLKRFLAHAAQRVGQGTAMSTRRVAMCAHHILDALVATLLLGVGLRGTLRRGLAYLPANARRANPDRDHRTGRLRAGLGLVEAA